MKRLVMAIALACALSGTALAGDIHTTGAPEPPPPQASSSVGDSHSTGAPEPSPQASSTVMATVLLIIVNALAP